MSTKLRVRTRSSPLTLYLVFIVLTIFFGGIFLGVNNNNNNSNDDRGAAPTDGRFKSSKINGSIVKSSGTHGSGGNSTVKNGSKGNSSETNRSDIQAAEKSILKEEVKVHSSLGKISKNSVIDSKIHKNATTCKLRPHPMPFILISLGRSGSSVTFRMVTKMTGEVTTYKELTGHSIRVSKRFFNNVMRNNDTQSNWALDHLCMRQDEFPNAGAVGFKWKPYMHTFTLPVAQDALDMIAHSADPMIKVVRLRRNLLDVFISKTKHRIGGDEVPPHCFPGDEECIKKHLEIALGMELPAKDLVEFLRQTTKEEDIVDQMLANKGVPHVKVSFEELYDSDDAEEWMRIFRFLGIGPAEGLTNKMINEHLGVEDVRTSAPTHKVALKNFEEVRDALGDEFAHLIH